MAGLEIDSLGIDGQERALSADEIEHPYRVSGPVTLEEAQRYCERLAKSHYENFLVAGIFCPKPLRQHFYNVYAYCRISDDLSDEIGDPRKSPRSAGLVGRRTERHVPGRAAPSRFVALAETVETFHIPAAPFRNLLTAFRQDQTTTRYPAYEDVLAYCVNSANPLGSLCCTCAGIRTRNGSRFRIRPAQRCSLPTSGRT